MNPWSISVSQLLTHKPPPPAYADMKKARVCACGETDPAKFYGGKAACKACIAKKLKVWRKVGAAERMATCICGKKFSTIKPNAKYCGPVCRNKGEREARKARDNV